jgi:DNA-directed RNA polymerase I and III subunit RPAC1
MDIKVIINKPEHLELEINGVDSSITNALRRIIIAEIPTMAFHKVFLYQNTSVLPD